VISVIEETKCRVCKGSLKSVLNLGSIYPSSFIGKEENSSDYEKAPLVVARCGKCGLFQLKHTVNLDSMYRQYWYRSGLNRSMLSDLKDVVNYVESKINVKNGDIVLDIGCNDGSMFSYYNKKVVKIGFDPALNLETEGKCDIFINDYFSADTYPLEKKAKVITTIAMFYDLPDPNKFIEDIKEVLDDNGVWVIQFTDLYSMVNINAFDNICHEHLEYYDLTYMDKLMSKHGLVVADAQYNKVNGGSVRLLVTKKSADFKVSANVPFYIEREKEMLSNPNFINDFQTSVSKQRDSLLSMLTKLKLSGGRVFGIGASTKGNTLLQVWGITNEMLDGIYEVNSDKFGLKTIGSEIPIVKEDTSSTEPLALILLPWHFADNILETYSEYLVNGGIIIAPLPTLKMYHIRGNELWILEKKQ
jgi:hypothetical protein